MAGRPRPRLYYVNTNFIVDLANEVPEAIEFAVRHKGLLYTSSLAVKEFARKGLTWLMRTICMQYDIVIVKLRKIRRKVIRDAKSAFKSSGASSLSTFIDYLHVYTAKYTGAKYFVTADEAACNRALRAGLCCINHRTGELRCPSEKSGR